MAYTSVFPFQLSDWQQRALRSIEDGNHCLVTAPTGSGKTVPAEYAIHYFTGKGKKVIYTSPIKALSNQKYYEFQQKFPNVSFGILTGDIKDNPEADVLIMTTEILCNHLHNLRHPESKLEFNIDMHDELGCVIFDEVHYINDADRGTVWEESFMLLPEHVQLVMLSATIATPEKFAGWIESIHPEGEKKVLLCDTSLRAVPLSHYMWLSTTTSVQKTNDQKVVNEVEKMANHPMLLYNEASGFQERIYYDMSKACSHLHRGNHFVKRQYVLNQVVGHLKKNEMLPAICFVYSRKNVEKFAKELTHSLIDSVKMNQVAKECRGILTRFPNYKEYMALPEYHSIVSLLEKGIGIHHSGLLPVFREMIELLFSKGYIQMLFATETFAVGLNMPTKTVLFTSLKKFDGTEHRYLLPHEYTQQAGRAGRRGYDTVGHVFHLTNLFEIPSITDYKVMLGNVPQQIISKLKISYSMILNCDNPEAFIKQSAIQHDIQKEVEYYEQQLRENKTRYTEMRTEIQKNSCTPIKVLEQITEMEDMIGYYKNKQRKAKEHELRTLHEQYPRSKEYLGQLRDLKALNDETTKMEKYIKNTKDYVDNQVSAIREILIANHFVDQRAEIARNIKEAHPLMMTDVFEKMERLDAHELVAFFSCFTNVNVGDEIKNAVPKCEAVRALQLIEMAKERLDHYYNEEIRTNIFSGACYDIHFDLADDCLRWSDCKTETECEQFLTILQNEKGVFIGEFVKAILKINAMTNEMIKVCEIIGMTGIHYTLSQIGELTLKSVCTTQSLYV